MTYCFLPIKQYMFIQNLLDNNIMFLMDQGLNVLTQDMGLFRIICSNVFGDKLLFPGPCFILTLSSFSNHAITKLTMYEI